MTDNPFAPIAGGDSAPRDQKPGFEPIIPVPTDAPKPRFRDSKLGSAAGVWPYYGADGHCQGYVLRFDHPVTGDGERKKEFRPLRFGDRNGKLGWYLCGWKSSRPIYRLLELLARPGAGVIVTEGEKACDAAARLFPELVAVAAMGGAGAPSKTDWSPLKGRRVVIAPDHDEPGARYAVAVAELARAAGAVSVETLPPEIVGSHVIRDGKPTPRGEPVPKSWDLADAEADGWTAALVEAFTKTRPLFETFEGAAPSAEPAPPIGGDGEFPSFLAVGPYTLDETGLWFEDRDGRSNGRRWLGPPFRVLAQTRNIDGADWGLLLEWRDRDGRAHTYAMPATLLVGDGAELRRELAFRGYIGDASRDGRARFLDFLTRVKPPERVRAVNKVGWAGCCFVLPDSAIGEAGDERVMLQTERPLDHAYRVAGTLEGWQEHVAKPAMGNRALVLAIGAAFAAPLLGPLGLEGGGFHFVGSSSIGKSTALAVAASVCGGGGVRGYIKPWRATDNALEGLAAAHSDGLLCLDEIAELDPRAAAAVSYMLANGSGKARSGRSGESRHTAEWRLLFLSTGEVTIADKIKEAGPKAQVAAGQAVRVIDLEADAGRGHGLFDHLSGFPSADALARALKAGAEAHFGHALRRWLEVLTGDRAAIVDAARAKMAAFSAMKVPAGADGQISRVAARFGLIAAAGELAIAAGILPWPPGEAIRAAEAMFDRWLARRGGLGSMEVLTGIADLRSFLFVHGMARFEPAWDGPLRQVEGEKIEFRVRDRAGFRKPVRIAAPMPNDNVARDDDAPELVDKGERAFDYYMEPDTWREVLRSRDHAAVAREMIARGWLKVGADMRPDPLVRVPGIGRMRLYRIPAAFLGGGVD